MRHTEKDSAPVPERPEIPAPLRTIGHEEVVTFGFVDRLFARPEPLPERQRVGPVFGGFRPVLGRPDSVPGEQALHEVMRSFDLDRPALSDEVIANSAECLAEVSFPDDPIGQALTEKLIRAVLRRQLETFGNDDRLQFGLAVGFREFSDDSRLAHIHARWVCGGVESEEESELQRELARRGVGIHELVAGNIWVRGEPSILLLDEYDPSVLAKFLENRGISWGPHPPDEGTPP